MGQAHRGSRSAPRPPLPGLAAGASSNMGLCNIREPVITPEIPATSATIPGILVAFTMGGRGAPTGEECNMSFS